MGKVLLHTRHVFMCAFEKYWGQEDTFTYACQLKCCTVKDFAVPLEEFTDFCSAALDEATRGRTSTSIGKKSWINVRISEN